MMYRSSDWPISVSYVTALSEMLRAIVAFTVAEVEHGFTLCARQLNWPHGAQLTRCAQRCTVCPHINPFTPKFKKYILPTFKEPKGISEVARIGSIIIFHLSKL